jgi:hypothetical protein
VKRLTTQLSALLLLILTAGCATSNASTNPVSSLHLAINSVLDAPDFTLVIKDTGSGGEDPLPPHYTSVMTAVIQKPDKFSMTETVSRQTTRVIAIGSVGYIQSEGESPYWSETNHVGESQNWTYGSLLYIDLLRRVDKVVRHGDTYVVPSSSAAGLLASSGLPRLQSITDLSLEATVQSGSLTAVQLRVSGSSPFSVTVTVSKIGTSPNVAAPNKADLA